MPRAKEFHQRGTTTVVATPRRTLVPPAPLPGGQRWFLEKCSICLGAELRVDADVSNEPEKKKHALQPKTNPHMPTHTPLTCAGCPQQARRDPLPATLASNTPTRPSLPTAATWSLGWGSCQWQSQSPLDATIPGRVLRRVEASTGRTVRRPPTLGADGASPSRCSALPRGPAARVQYRAWGRGEGYSFSACLNNHLTIRHACFSRWGKLGGEERGGREGRSRVAYGYASMSERHGGVERSSTPR